MVLVAPLDWGLGHATRCIPIIRELLAIGCEVIIAAEGAQKIILQQQFPHVRIIHLTGYNISYASSSYLTKWKLILQAPRIFSCIRHEHQWLKEKVEEYRFDLVISDNRYGLYHDAVPSIFITHQLLIKSSFGYSIDLLLQKINYRLISRFTRCWIPDYNEGDNNLAGELSHPALMPPIPYDYLGTLSRFAGMQFITVPAHVLIVLSGPEPQRSILERIILTQLAVSTEPAVLVRGLPAAKSLPSTGNPLLNIFNHVDTEHFHQLVLQARVVVCRSGYTSIMDLVPNGIPCAFIPTPGQAEQLYLAAYLSAKRLCLTYKQEEFKLSVMLEDLQHFNIEKPGYDGDAYKKIIGETLNRLVAAG